MVLTVPANCVGRFCVYTKHLEREISVCDHKTVSYKCGDDVKATIVTLPFVTKYSYTKHEEKSTVVCKTTSWIHYDDIYLTY